jgi:hypothetical protein
VGVDDDHDRGVHRLHAGRDQQHYKAEEETRVSRHIIRKGERSIRGFLELRAASDGWR